MGQIVVWALRFRPALLPFTSGSRREPLIDGQSMPTSNADDGQTLPPKEVDKQWLSTEPEARTRLLPHPVRCGSAGRSMMMSWAGRSARGGRGHRPRVPMERGLELPHRPAVATQRHRGQWLLRRYHDARRRPRATVSPCWASPPPTRRLRPSRPTVGQPGRAHRRPQPGAHAAPE